MHVAIYVRVSSKSQDMRLQERDLERWAQFYADGQEVRWYRDAWSGATMQRPGWDELERGIHAGEVARVVVWRFDRLGRTASGLAALVDELIRRRVGLVSIREGFDIDTPSGRLMANLLGSMAQYEREVSKERQAAGIAAARAQGKTWGGRQKGQRWKVKPETITAITDLRSGGASIASIARVVKLTRGTIYDVLRSTTAGVSAT